MDELSFNFDFNLDFFSDLEVESNIFETRYIKPPKPSKVPIKCIKYDKALKLAEDLGKPVKDFRAYAIISGNFIMGDFIEGYVVKHNLHVKELLISTLSMSQENIDSLRNLFEGDYADQINLISSDFWFSHERRGLVPYMYEELDTNNKFQFAASGSHCKIALIETHCGKKIVMHGSSNLRSSGNIEQIAIEENEELFDFNHEYQHAILEEYKTINKSKEHKAEYKSLRRKKLWQRITHLQPTT